VRLNKRHQSPTELVNQAFFNAHWYFTASDHEIVECSAFWEVVFHQ
jgi:hypothetical protein